MGDTEEIVVPSGWLQKMNKREFLGLIVVCVSVGTWVHSTNQSMASMQRELTETKAEIRAYIKEQDKRNEQASNVLAVLGYQFVSIDSRLKNIETNVRKMAQ